MSAKDRTYVREQAGILDDVARSDIKKLQVGSAAAHSDSEVAQVEQYYESMSEHFPDGFTKENLVEGFKPARKFNEKLTAKEYLAA